MKNIEVISTTAPDGIKKKEAKKELKKLHRRIFSLQNLFYADGKHALLIILQGMDTSGKDGTIRHVFSCINPQGCRVKSFKSPSEEEKRHDFLWRVYSEFPEKRMFKIFNRSYYEDILFPVVHHLIDKKEVAERHKLINEVEDHLQKNGTVILKFFLHISEKEQIGRIEERLADPEKKWKYTTNDTAEAKKWDDYVSAYQQVLDGCEKHNPWIIIPADQKWYRNYLVATTMLETLAKLKMKYPK